MRSLDTNYDERLLFPHQAFFPMAGKGEGWNKPKKDIRAELDEDRLPRFHGTVTPNPEWEAAWAAEARSRIDAYRWGEIQAVDADEMHARIEKEFGLK